MGEQLSARQETWGVNTALICMFCIPGRARRHLSAAAWLIGTGHAESWAEVFLNETPDQRVVGVVADTKNGSMVLVAVPDRSDRSSRPHGKGDQ